MVPLWIVVSSLLIALFASRRTTAGFLTLYLAACLDGVYHLGSAWEYLRAGSLRFFWEALILEERLEELFPAEPLQSWSYIVAAVLVGLAGILAVGG
jgi:hypothetical protein